MQRINHSGTFFSTWINWKTSCYIFSWYFCSVNESKPHTSQVHTITDSQYIPKKKILLSFIFAYFYSKKRRRFNHFSLSLSLKHSHTHSPSFSKPKKQCLCRCSSHASQAQCLHSPSNAPFWCAALRRSSPTWRWWTDRCSTLGSPSEPKSDSASLAKVAWPPILSIF